VEQNYLETPERNLAKPQKWLATLGKQQNDQPPENAVSGNEPKLENGTGQKSNAPKSELAELLRYLVPQDNRQQCQQTRRYRKCRPTTQTVLPMLGNSPLA